MPYWSIFYYLVSALLRDLFKNIKIINKFKILKYHPIGKFSNIIDLRKLDFLRSEEKISERSRFVNKDVTQS